MTLAPVATPSIPQPTVGETDASVVREYTVAEFFAGIGLARLGLESASASFKVTWANDLAPDKQDMYVGHFGASEADHYRVEDIEVVAKDIEAAGLPTNLDLAWASFPCTDLSLAGGRQGLAGKSSGTFWHFTEVLAQLGANRPAVVALENVNGLATSHGGADIKEAIRKLNELEYSVDVITLDARSWVPQSRPRLFLVACKTVPVEDERRSTGLRPSWLDPILDDPNLTTHRARLRQDPPKHRSEGWTELVENSAETEYDWWDDERTAKFLGELSGVQNTRVKALKDVGLVAYRTAYRRTRNGRPAWEIRADDIAGCLRTAGGGSSKQAVVRIDGSAPLQVRWMTPLEYASLMGAGDYVLPKRRNQSIMGFGDAVCVDAVRWLADHYLEPLLSGKLARQTNTRTPAGKAS